MNRYLEHDGMKRGLKSQDCAKVLKAVQGYIPDNWHTCFQEVKGALQAADYIALAEKPAPYTKAPQVFVYEHLDRYFNEWFAITREKWLSLYGENNRRVCSSNTYGPTLRIKYPCGYVGFKGIPTEQGNIYPSWPIERDESAPEGFRDVSLLPAPKSKDRKQIEDLLETHEPEITRYEVKYKSAVPELRIEFYPKDKDGLVAAAPKRLFPDGQPPAPARVVPEEPKQFVSDGIKIEFVPHTPAPDHRTDKYLEVCGRGKRHRVSDMGITLDLRIPNNMRPTQVIDSSPINVKIGPSVIWIKYNAEKNEWEEILAEPQPEPIKPEQLDPKACRQFVEQLLAFDELDKNRTADSWQFLVTLLSNPYIGVLSYLTFLEAYKK